MALLARYASRDPAMPQFISNHGVRMIEASLRASGLPGLELQAWDFTDASLDALADELLAYDPDVAGFSAYLWSFPLFVEVAEAIKRDDPRRLVVFGGPSACPSMLGRKPFRWVRECIDALVINEGEHTFLEIVALADRSAAALAAIPGIALPKARAGARPARARRVPHGLRPGEPQDGFLPRLVGGRAAARDGVRGPARGGRRRGGGRVLLDLPAAALKRGATSRASASPSRARRWW